MKGRREFPRRRSSIPAEGSDDAAASSSLPTRLSRPSANMSNCDSEYSDWLVPRHLQKNIFNFNKILPFWCRLSALLKCHMTSLKELLFLVTGSVFEVNFEGTPLEGRSGHLHAERETRVARPERLQKSNSVLCACYTPL